MSDRIMKCWICGDDATTDEHKTKRSDLASVNAPPTHMLSRVPRA